MFSNYFVRALHRPNFVGGGHHLWVSTAHISLAHSSRRWQIGVSAPSITFLAFQSIDPQYFAPCAAHLNVPNTIDLPTYGHFLIFCGKGMDAMETYTE